MSRWFCGVCYFDCLNLLKGPNQRLYLFTLPSYFFFKGGTAKRVMSYAKLTIFFLLQIVLNIFVVFIWLLFFHAWLQKSFLFNILFGTVLVYFCWILKLLANSLVLKVIKGKTLVLWRLNALYSCYIIDEQICKWFFIWIIKSGRLRNSSKSLSILLTRVKTLTEIFFIRKIITITFTSFVYISSIWLI
jgi:hypothetical protein